MPSKILVLEVCVDSIQSAVRFARAANLSISLMHASDNDRSLAVALQVQVRIGLKYAGTLVSVEERHLHLVSSERFRGLFHIYQSWLALPLPKITVFCSPTSSVLTKGYGSAPCWRLLVFR